MATLDELRARSDALYTELLKAQVTRGEVAAAEADTRGYSWFEREDAVASAALAFRLGALAASGQTLEDGLGAALDNVQEERGRADPEQVQIGLALFITHNDDGRRLGKPRSVIAAPELFTAAAEPPSASEDDDGIHLEVSIGGLSPNLDYWREDALSNEHHEHWHEVYPWPGLLPRRFMDWLAQRTQQELVDILNGIQPDPNWPSIVAASTPAQLARTFATVFKNDSQGNVMRLPRNLYGLLFHLNDRQGELFFYMHEQMLARYDTELLSHGLARVEPFGPAQWSAPIAAGHDPIEFPPNTFGKRPPNQTLPRQAATALHSLWDEIDNALQTKSLRALGGGTVPIDRENLGEAVEPTVPQLRALDEGAYGGLGGGGLHNTGHGRIARLANPQGVMKTPKAAIRDPVFWQWHKAIDNLSASWQEGLAPYPFDDSPPVLLRNALDPSARTPWTSPDIILCRTADLPTGADPAQLGTQLFGGASWSTDFTSGQASANGTSLTTIDELTTKMEQATMDGRPVTFLTHTPFSYFLRIENTSGSAVAVTVRIFLVFAHLAADRRAWMEMDKFSIDLPAGRQVVYRPDSQSAIVKRPVDASPPTASRSNGDSGEEVYCDCGWPYTLLLPRGKPEGMPFRLLAFCTDAAIDHVPQQGPCGSMSYCGAVDRYPDTRDMGYPFSRPFGPGPTAIQDRFVALDCAGARTVTIRHVQPA